MKKTLKIIGYLIVGIVTVILICFLAVWLYFQLSPILFKNDIKNIEARYTQFHAAISAEDYEEAFTFMTPMYRQSHTLEEFEREFYRVGGRWLELEPGRYLRVYGKTATLYPRNSEPDEFWAGPQYKLVKIAGEWYIQEYLWFTD